MTEQYKCRSYYDDNNVLKNCTCGKCAPTPPQETSKAGEDWETRFTAFIHGYHGDEKSLINKDEFFYSQNGIMSFIAQEKKTSYAQGRADMAGEVREIIKKISRSNEDLSKFGDGFEEAISDVSKALTALKETLLAEVKE